MTKRKSSKVRWKNLLSLDQDLSKISAAQIILIRFYHWKEIDWAKHPKLRVVPRSIIFGLTMLWLTTILTVFSFGLLFKTIFKFVYKFVKLLWRKMIYMEKVKDEDRA